MSGHSKWSTIKRKKAATDAKRSKVWTKVIKEVTVAARIGGGDPTGNPRLRLAIDKARSVNMPKDTLKRAIDKGVGAGSADNWEDIVYEGYGPSGVAVVVECMTDNRNRTVSEVRHCFERFGGNMGASGSVAWMFQKKGLIYIEKEGVTEEQVMEAALEAGAEDVRDEEEVWTVECTPNDFIAVKEALDAAGIKVSDSEIDNIPENRVEVPEGKAESVIKLLAMLEDLDDVQNVYSNHDIPDDILEQFGE